MLMCSGLNKFGDPVTGMNVDYMAVWDSVALIIAWLNISQRCLDCVRFTRQQDVKDMNGNKIRLAPTKSNTKTLPFVSIYELDNAFYNIQSQTLL